MSPAGCGAHPCLFGRSCAALPVDPGRPNPTGGHPRSLHRGHGDHRGRGRGACLAAAGGALGGLRGPDGVSARARRIREGRRAARASSSQRIAIGAPRRNVATFLWRPIGARGDSPHPSPAFGRVLRLLRAAIHAAPRRSAAEILQPGPQAGRVGHRPSAGAPVKLPWQADLVVKASRELSDIEKLIWCEDRGLDQSPEGCYLGGGTLGARLGRSPDTIERTRRELVRLDLHRTQPHAGTKSASWFALLPDDAVPVCPPGVVDPGTWRPDPADVRRLADRLDAHVYSVRGHRAYERTGGSGATSHGGGAAAGVPPDERTTGGKDAAARTGLAAAQSPKDGTGAATNGGRAAGRMAAGVPPRSKQLVRERSSSSGDESEPVAHATKAESDNDERPAPTGREQPRCDNCGEPLGTAPSGRFVICPCAAAGRPTGEFRGAP